MTNCGYDECLSDVWAKGLCNGHYLQAWKGQELKPLRLRLTDGQALDANTVKTDTCWLWTGATTNGGYGILKGRKLVHRVSYELHKGAIPAGLHIRHQCHNRLCVNPAHLLVGTAQENMDDSVRDGRLPTGEQHHNCVLTDSEVEAIRLDTTSKQKDLAVKYGVSNSLISSIKTGRRRKLRTSLSE